MPTTEPICKLCRSRLGVTRRIWCCHYCSDNPVLAATLDRILKNPLSPGENTCPQVCPSDQAPLNHGTAEPYPDRRST